MYIILSQRIDIESEYSDDLFQLYHYPARYKNQIHEGDIFIYYQGDRLVKEHRYYFGTGKIGHIWTDDGENYYATIVEAAKFLHKVPIYQSETTYYESIGFRSVRNSIQPPWQSSVRPLSIEAYNAIIKQADQIVPIKSKGTNALDSLELQLKNAVKDYYRNSNTEAILDIQTLAVRIAAAHGLKPTVADKEVASDIRLDLHCLEMPMSYSYKAVLLLGMFDLSEESEPVAIEKMASFFQQYYSNRKAAGKKPERNGIYLRDGISLQKIIENIETNPLNALCGAGVLEYFQRHIRFGPRVDRHNPSWAEDARYACLKRLDQYFEKLETKND